MSADAFVLALKATFDPRAAGDLEASVDLRLEDDAFKVAVANGRLAVTRASAENADATVHTDVETLRDVAFGGRRVDEAAASGALRVEGDGDALQHVLDAFAKRATAAG